MVFQMPLKLRMLRFSINISYSINTNYIRGAFIIYCNSHRNSHVMHEIPMKSKTGYSSVFYLSMDTSIVPIGALVFCATRFGNEVIHIDSIKSWLKRSVLKLEDI